MGYICRNHCQLVVVFFFFQVVLVIDTSSSMGQRLELVKQKLHQLIQASTACDMG